MGRPPRYSITGYPLHVVHRGNNRQPIFRMPADLRVYRRYLGEALDKFRCALHAYVLMTNHVHLLVTPERETSLARTMQSLGGRYARYFNKAYDRSGTLYEGRYRASLIESDSYLLACYRYIELNPVRAGLVADPGQYPHSSYWCHAFGRADALVAFHPVYVELGANALARRRAYRELVAAGLDDQTLRRIRLLTAGSWALGSEDFLTRMTGRLARPVRPSAAGRPRRH